MTKAKPKYYIIKRKLYDYFTSRSEFDRKGIVYIDLCRIEAGLLPRRLIAVIPKQALSMNDELVELTADVVSAYVRNNSVPAAELPKLIASISQSLSVLGIGQALPEPEPQKPAVNPKKSIHADHIVCLEDGKTFKSLKHHLMTNHGLTPEEYRTKWRLPADYPMVAPSSSATRSAMAKRMGLGRKPIAKAARRKAKA